MNNVHKHKIRGEYLGSQTQKHVLPNRIARVAEVRPLARMGRQIPYRTPPDGAVDNAERSKAPILGVS